MKRQAMKWIIAASAIIFLVGGTAWADGKGNRGRHKGGHGKSYHSAPHHNSGHGPTHYQKRPPLGKHHGKRVHRAPSYRHKRPHHNYGHYRPHHRPHHGHGIHRHHHYHGKHRVKAIGVKSRDIHSSVALSFLTGNPLFALDAIINR